MDKHEDQRVKITEYVRAAGWAGKTSPGDLSKMMKQIDFPSNQETILDFSTSDDAGV